MNDQDGQQEAATLGRWLAEHPDLDAICKNGFAAMWTEDDQQKPPSERVDVRLFALDGMDDTAAGRVTMHGHELETVPIEELVSQQEPTQPTASAGD